MSQRLDDRTNETIKIGNSYGFRIKKSYLEIAGMDQPGQKVEEAILTGKHGIYIIHHLPGEQPQLQDIEQQKLQKIIKEKTGEK